MADILPAELVKFHHAFFFYITIHLFAILQVVLYHDAFGHFDTDCDGKFRSYGLISLDKPNALTFRHNWIQIVGSITEI